MRKLTILLTLLAAFLILASGCERIGDLPPGKAHAESPGAAETHAAPPAAENPAEPNGCGPAFRALYDHAVVELEGEGEGEVLVVTDPLCWHCRLGHKLLAEYPKLWGKLRYSFFPRSSFIGSDMAAWVLEDAAGTDRLHALTDYAYTDLKQPKTDDLMTARMIVLVQFTQAFPDLLEGTSLEALFVRLQKDHEAHVLESAQMARAADLPGTPILAAGKRVVLGFGPGPWLKVLEEAEVCP
ncbi:MAG: hypothetical protein AB7E51_01480 [Pseudodesulfovibrio sp.]|uniref:Thioredoxin-like fold domain-containing protein n=1 Tax=Pseudodesulfovibrio indicus TaxID=1716143 RepID=A0A126QRQ2_9BACT|nr:hypothetical protein [Pseudodesulfovibrio indicus]AMK12419.1 hypothetical protein AWY79_15575 [Pseudodesulfovibrio indicus]TDT90718.1 hypothetical protein EDC59_102148 [Pseudodesulfovibrio indicus]